MQSGLNFTLKSPTIEQLPEIVDLDRRCLGGIWSLDGYQREWDSPNSELLILTVSQDKIENDGVLDQKIIGCGCFWAILEEAHITLLMIDADYQSQGLGQLLLCSLLKSAVDRHLERATLEVRESNQAAISLYQKFGFQALGRRKGYYKQTGEDAIILWRNNLHHPQFQDDLRQWEQRVCDRIHQQGHQLNQHPPQN